LTSSSVYTSALKAPRRPLWKALVGGVLDGSSSSVSSLDGVFGGVGGEATSGSPISAYIHYSNLT